MTEQLYNVVIVSMKTGFVEATIGSNLTEKQADTRELTGLSRIDTSNYFIRREEVKA